MTSQVIANLGGELVTRGPPANADPIVERDISVFPDAADRLPNGFDQELLGQLSSRGDPFMSTGIRRQVSLGPAGVLASATIITLLAIAAPAGAINFCGGPGQRPCPPFPLCGTPGTAPCPGTLLDTYFDIPVGDNVVRLINPMSSSTNLCAMTYVFNSEEVMGECCGCPLSPPKPLSFSVDSNLTADWALMGDLSAARLR